MQVNIKIDFKEDTQNPKDIPEYIPEEAKFYWDDIEIHPVKEIEKGIVETVEEGEEDFWSI
ncbi:MAG: hypothetical protein ACP5D9_04990 [Mariniphaga sp.]